MFDKMMLCDEGFENAVENGETIGFSLLARLPYYRGLGLSMIEDIGLTIDGEPVKREDIRFSVRGRSWTLDEMETVYDDRWNFGEKAKVTVLRTGGLTPGAHKVDIAVRMRVSYLPFVPTTKTGRELQLAA
ncbi:C-glycoside deglycosidase beta subunit domain-containing protein [Sphingobium abikonense]|uniref:C-glycoside deglycosidase beta subunit domain-containing protein n=1 Tax=Sphingobium abikonense TaxID=86193 RepID=UPI0007895615|nr:DUF6379 domain-containing protein [Sphingobium abikonense]